MGIGRWSEACGSVRSASSTTSTATLPLPQGPLCASTLTSTPSRSLCMLKAFVTSTAGPTV
eukprot:5684320-Prymnesium_polylepis.2